MYIRLNIFFIAIALYFSSNVHAATPAAERDALIALYNATEGGNWFFNEGWSGEEGAHCNWHGVSCSEDGAVITLSLAGNKLNGEFPLGLFELSQLQNLNLSRNNFHGSIPHDLLINLPQLVSLNLSGNEFTGGIPNELEDSSSIAYLDLSRNKLTGPIPTELDNSTQLQYLNLSGNALSGGIPIELAQIGQLKYLNLGNNPLGGEIPKQLSELSQLSTLDIYSNQLSGTIPSELALLTRLQALNLSGNLLTGGIPKEIGLLTELTRLRFIGNQLDGVIPPELGALRKLVILHLGKNQFTGSIPQEFRQLTKLKLLTLDNNKLRGSITNEFDDFAEMERLSLNDNCFDFGDYTFLASLKMVENLDLGDQNACEENARHIPLVQTIRSSRIYIPAVIVDGKEYRVNLYKQRSTSELYWRVNDMELINEVVQQDNPAVEFDTKTSTLTFNQIHMRDQIISATLHIYTPPYAAEEGIYFRYIP